MKHPATPAEWSAYRATLSCEIGIEAIEGTKQLPDGISRRDYAICCLLHAVRSLAEIHFNPKQPKQ